MSMDLATARSTVRLYGRSASDPTFYSNTQVDYSIYAAGEELVRRCYLLPKVSTLTLTANNNDLPSLPTGFRPDLLMSAYLSGSNVQVNPNQSWNWMMQYGTIGAPMFVPTTPTSVILRQVSFDTVLNQLYAYNVVQQPQVIAFNTTTTGKVYPTPNENYTLNLLWNEQFTKWDYGARGSWVSIQNYVIGDLVQYLNNVYQCVANNSNEIPASNPTYWNPLGPGTVDAPTNIILNIPDDYYPSLLMYGAVSKMQFPDPEMKFSQYAAQKWEEYILAMAGKNNLGTEEIQLTGMIR